MARVQLNVRVEPELIPLIDARRNTLGLSRDEWMRRLIRWGLEQPPNTASTHENASNEC